VFSRQTCKILKIPYYQNHGINSNQILHNDKDHKVHFTNISNRTTDFDEILLLNVDGGWVQRKERGRVAEVITNDETNLIFI